jgi:hypothetical protein
MHRIIKVILSVICVLMAAAFSGAAVNAAAETTLPTTTASATITGSGAQGAAAGTTTRAPNTWANGQTMSMPTIRAGSPTVARAAQDSMLPPGLVISDQSGISANAHGEYYIAALGLMPGDVIKKTVTIQNLEISGNPQADIPFSLSLRAEQISKDGPLDLFEEVSLELKLDGNVIYTGNSRGDKGTNGSGAACNMVTTPLDLGNYKIGDRRDLEVTLRVSPTMTVHEEQSEALFRWIFYAVKTEDAVPPVTGLLQSYGIYLIPVASTLLLCFFLVLSKKKKERDQRLAEAAAD